MTKLNIDLSNLEDDMGQQKGYNLVPEDDYTAKIISTEVQNKVNKEGSKYTDLNLAWQIQEGPYKKRQVYDNVYLKGESEKGIKYGKRKLKDIAVVIGLSNPNRLEDSNDLIGKPCVITVFHKEFNNKTSEKISGYAKASAVPSSLTASNGTTDPFADDDSSMPF